MSREKRSKTSIYCADFENLELEQCNVRPLGMNKNVFQEKASKDQQQCRHIVTPTQVKNWYNVTLSTQSTTWQCQSPRQW